MLECSHLVASKEITAAYLGPEDMVTLVQLELIGLMQWVSDKHLVRHQLHRVWLPSSVAQNVVDLFLHLVLTISLGV